MMNKKKPRDVLTHTQYQINWRARKHTHTSNQWLIANGITATAFYQLPIELLHAHHVAHTLLTQHADLLTPQQAQLLTSFQHQVQHNNTRVRLQVKAAYPVLNIGNKINRQIYRQHRQLNQ